MYLHKLELHGFKSFADRTEIQFASGVTAIVGPNGCGKSNIIDAVRWVLGEQRSRLLRSEKMENVIFNGSTGRKPLGLAEVSLTIENTRNVLPTQYSHVTITRRLYRSGESEYQINKSPCRLKDIIDLFMDTGMGAHAYSVIELKMTDEILSENAQDRRTLFEEASGITKYKLRRTQALRKLKSTQTDMLRVRDLVDELDKRVQSLSRQAQKAARHRELSSELRGLELQLAQAEYLRLSAERERLQTESRTIQDRIEGLTTQQTGQEATIEAMRTELVRREQALADSQRVLNEHVERLRGMEADIRLEKTRAEGAAQNLQRAEEERVAAEKRRERLGEEAQRLTGELLKAKPALEAAQAAKEEAERERDDAQTRLEVEREALERLRTDEQAWQKRLTAATTERNRLAAQLELLERQLEQTARRLVETEGQLTALSAEEDRAKADLELRRGRHQSLVERRQAAEAQQREIEERRESLRSVLGAAERHLASVETEIELLEGLLASFDDFSESVAFLARETGWATGSPLTVADVLACDDQDRAAIDALLGDFASCFVVATERDAEAGMSLLREREKGRAAFIVLERLPALSAPGPDVPGARPAAEAVRVSSEAYRPLVHVLLRDCFIADSLADARALARAVGAERPGVRVASLTGEWAEGRGRVHGGSRQAGVSSAAHRIGRRERLQLLQEEHTVAAGRVRQLADDIQREGEMLVQLGLPDLRKGEREAEQQVDASTRLLDQARYRATLQGQSKERLAAEGTDMTARSATIRERVSALEGEEAAAGDGLRQARGLLSQGEQRFSAVDDEARAAFARYGEVNLAAVQAANAVETIARERNRVTADLRLLDESDRRREENVRQFREQMEQALARRVELEAAVVQAYREKSVMDGQVAEAEGAVNEVKGGLSEHDVALRDVRRLREDALRQDSARAARMAELGARLEDLVTRVHDEYDLRLDAMAIDVADDFDAVAARAAIPELRQKIRNLGAVNELALESYQEEKERLDFLTEQLADLERAENTLLETIDEINTTASERFMETFNAIRENFSRLFLELFGEGANADVVLTGDQDPLESEIEIIAYPRGKKPSTISQLSGGEKTLTATALLFAIYLVKPSPFCILDEVDAPLDDANVQRFMRMIRAFSGSTQFILVTHNKLTMEAADRLYGVTMPEQGISKLVGVRFDELEVQERAA